MGQRGLAISEAAQTGAEQHVRAVLDQGHEAELREGALATAGFRASESNTVLFRVGDVETGAIQARQAPLPVPGTSGGAGRYRPHHLFVQAAQWGFAQAGA